jgi:hypothetical protein
MNLRMREREHDRLRIQRLRALAARLEALPRSPARDRLLRQAHHRAVTVDTGEPSMGLGADEPEHVLFQHLALQATARFSGRR